ncbi:cytochrome c family protein [sediment metagenome]|uniref:Cytochrome c family protein n=1 Tax=sediment metagenome TaxID=749907 RepID=D9PHD4_9ZZZZ
MNKLLIIPALFMLGGCVNQSVTQNKDVQPKILSQEESIKADAINKINDFVNLIKPLLMSSLKADPTGESGMDMCSASAQELTKDYNKKLSSDIKIRRTAIKYRNVLNKPDNIDKQVMNQMIASKSISPVMIKTKNGYRVYQPLANLQPCLACHGDMNTMNPKTVAKIKKYYPKDLANGFKLNDFRGVVVAEIKK